MCAFLLKLQVVQVCQSPGASVAAAALALELNANLVRHWLRDSQGGAACAVAVVCPPSGAFVEVPMPARVSAPTSEPIRSLKAALRR